MHMCESVGDKGTRVRAQRSEDAPQTLESEPHAVDTRPLEDIS